MTEAANIKTAQAPYTALPERPKRSTISSDTTIASPYRVPR